MYNLYHETSKKHTTHMLHLDHLHGISNHQSIYLYIFGLTCLPFLNGLQRHQAMYA